MAARRRTGSGLDPRISFAALLTFSFVLALLDSHGAFGLLRTVREVASASFSPLQNAAHAITNPLSSFLKDWSEVGSKNERIGQLKEENSKLRQQLLTVADIERRADAINHLFRVAGLGGFKIVSAQVMSLGSSEGFGSTALLDVGSADGVKINQTVMAGQGMIGRIISVTAHTATVILLTDPTSTVGARVQNSGQIGFLSGTGDSHSLKLQFIDPAVVVKVGDALVSYGVKGGVFLPGIPLGKVTYVENAQGTNSHVATVEPFADFSALDIVAVIVNKPRTDPRDALIPEVTPQPTVTVTATMTSVPTMSASATPTASATPKKSGVK